MTSRKIPESAVENLVSDLEGKVDKTSTQTISGSKRFTQPSAGMSIELTADTNQQTVPTTATVRQLGLYRNATYTKGDGYTSWMFGERGSDGHNSTGICVRRFLESDSQEIINYVNVYITPDGIPATYTKTPPAGCVGEEIVTAEWVRNACLLPGEIIIWSAPTPPAGYLVCDGSAISRTTYSRLFQVIGTTWGAGDGNTTFNLPNFNDKIPQGSGSRGTVGAYLSESLPNISGKTGFARNVSGGGWVGTYNPSGCFYQDSTNTGNGLGSSQTTVTAGVLGFAASGSSSTYKDKAPVQQAATVVCFCIRY